MNWCIRQDSHLQTLRSKRRMIIISPRMRKMVGCLGFAPSSRRLRAGTSLPKFATLMAVCKDRDTKAELNHRGQICEVLIDTGISRRGNKNPKRTESGVQPGACASTFDRA